MKIRFGIAAVLVAVALIAGGIAAAIASGGDDAADSTTSGTGFVGLTVSDATSRADDEGRPWRIGREDDESFAVTDDHVPGRVTFEIDDGVVTAAVIEEPSLPSPDDDAVVPDAARAELLAAALRRLVTVDNSFGGGDVFLDIRIGTLIGAEQPLAALERDAIIAGLSESGDAQFVDDPNAQMRDLFDEPFAGVAIVTVDRLTLLDDRAEVELSLWCGPLCGMYLTYEAVPTDGGGWTILGTTGPIAVS